MKIFGMMIALVIIIASIACESSPDLARPASTIPASADSAAQGSYLEKFAKDIGVFKDDDGHLLVDGNADVKFLRLITYFNAEAKIKRVEGASNLYKVSGLYRASTSGKEGYSDSVKIRVQVSSDDFEVPADPSELADRTNMAFSRGGYEDPRADDSYEALDALLEYLNAIAANEGRKYKLKAWYETRENERKLLSDRIDIVVQFSFEEKMYAPTSDLALYTRNLSFAEERQKSVLSRIAVDFSRLIKSDAGVMNILTLDFSGDNEQGPDYAYVFEGRDIDILKEIHSGEKAWTSALKILALAEAKNPAWTYIVAGQLKDVPDSPESSAPRTKEPIGRESQEVVAYIAAEIVRVINPASLEIEIHEFKGKAPKQLTVWSYMFDAEDIKVLRGKELSVGDTLKMASVVEQISGIPGGRTIPAFKPIIK